jgi:hypothetical protein
MSGRHVQPFVPGLSVRISILSFIATIAASALTAAGAADIALFIISSSVFGGVTGPAGGWLAAGAEADGGGDAVCWGVPHAAAATTAAMTSHCR